MNLCRTLLFRRTYWWAFGVGIGFASLNQEIGSYAKAAEVKPVPQVREKGKSLRLGGQPLLGNPSVGTKPPAESFQGEFADAFPSPIRLAPTDLALDAEGAKKAQALASFAGGLLAEENSDQEKMLEGYRKALELDPSNVQLAVKVAYELARRNDPTSAIQVLKDAIKACPKDALPYIFLSELYAKNLNKPELAIRYAEQGLALAPDNFAALQGVYGLYFSSGQEKKAEQLLDRATKSSSTDANYWAQLGELEARLWLQPDGSVASGKLEKLNAAFRRASELGANDISVLTRVADFYVLSRQVKLAIPYYLAITKLPSGPNDPPLNNVRDKLARCFLVTSQPDGAIEQLEAIVKESPLRVETYELLGELYLQKDDLEKAVANFELSLRLDAPEPSGHERLGLLLIRTKHYERAIDVLAGARKRYPDRPVIAYLLGIASSQAKHHEESVQAFADALVIAETNQREMLNGEFYFSYGAAAEQAGKVDKAVDLLKLSIKMEPEVPQAYNYLGYMWADRNERLEEAAEMIKKALSLEPGKGEYLDSLGWCSFRKGEFEQALKELLEARASILREDKKDDPTVLDHLGEVYLQMGKVSEAVGLWEKSLAIEGNKNVAEKLRLAKEKLGKD